MNFQQYFEKLGTDYKLSPSSSHNRIHFVGSKHLINTFIVCTGTASEGWFDPWLLLTHFKKKILSMGVKYINGEVTDIQTDSHGQVSGIKVSPALVASAGVDTQNC